MTSERPNSGFSVHSGITLIINLLHFFTSSQETVRIAKWLLRSQAISKLHNTELFSGDEALVLGRK